MLETLFALLADEAHNRVVSTIIDITMALGTIVPLTIAAATYVINTREQKRRDVIKVLLSWTPSERRTSFTQLLSQSQYTEYSSLTDDSKRVVAEILNSDEFIAATLLRNRKLRNTGKKMLYEVFVQDWRLTSLMINELRAKYNNSHLYENLEQIITKWTSESLRAYKFRS